MINSFHFITAGDFKLKSDNKPNIPWASKPEDLPQADIPAFPGAEGGGMYSFGGRGGNVIIVTSLKDSGPGTLRNACSQEGPRIVVFNVAGIIRLDSPIDVDEPYHTDTRRLNKDSYKLGIITHPNQVGGYPEYKGEPYLDSDGDGIPDDWEEFNGLDPNNSSDAILDYNNNGYMNIEEYINDLEYFRNKIKAVSINLNDIRKGIESLELGGKCIFFKGAPGTGKTQMGEIVAKDFGAIPSTTYYQNCSNFNVAKSREFMDKLKKSNIFGYCKVVFI